MVARMGATAVGHLHRRPTPVGWHAPSRWLSQAVCIHQHEGAWNANTGNGYYGGMQFLPGTYRSVGGRSDGRADLDAPREQLYRAWLLYRRNGSHWWISNGGSWGNSAPACGLA